MCEENKLEFACLNLFCLWLTKGLMALWEKMLRVQTGAL